MLIVSLFAILCLWGLSTSAVIVFQQMPLTATVNVTSSGPQSPPTLVSFWCSSHVLADYSQSWTIRLRAENCSGECAVVVTASNTPDLSLWSEFTSYQLTVAFGTTSGGQFEVIRANQPIYPEMGRGNYSLIVKLRSNSGLTPNTLARSYGPKELDDLFGSGASQLTNLDAAGSPYPWATVDSFSVGPRVITSVDQPISVSIHVSTPTWTLMSRMLDTIEVRCSVADVFDVGEFRWMSSPLPQAVEGWFNLTGVLGYGAGWYYAPSSVVAGQLQSGQYSCSLLIQHQTGYKQRVASPQLRAAGFDPTITLTGADFSSDHTPPNCNITLPASLNVAVSNQIPFTFRCDEPLYKRAYWLMPPTVDSSTPIFLPEGEPFKFYSDILSSGGTTNNMRLAQATPPGNYSIYGLWVSDKAGNVAVYMTPVDGSAQPGQVVAGLPLQLLPTGLFNQDLDDLSWLTVSDLNRHYIAMTAPSSSSMAVRASSSSSGGAQAQGALSSSAGGVGQTSSASLRSSHAQAVLVLWSCLAAALIKTS